MAKRNNISGVSAVANAAAEIAATAPEARDNASNSSGADSTAGLGSVGSPSADAAPQPIHNGGGAELSGSAGSTQPNLGAITDRHGQPWDPSKHAAGSDGKGILTSKGEWRAKRQSKSAAVGKPPQPTVGPVVAGSAVAFDPHKAAQAGRDAAFTIHAVLGSFGAEWRLSADEDKAGQEAMSRYFVAKNIGDFPPGVALVMVYGSILGRRMTMESTQKRMTGLRLRIAAWWIRRKLARQGIRAKVTIDNGEVLIDGKPRKDFD